MAKTKPKKKKVMQVGVEFDVERVVENNRAFKPIGAFLTVRHNRHYWRYHILIRKVQDEGLLETSFYDRTTTKLTLKDVGTTIRTTINALCDSWHSCTVRAYVVPDEVAKKELPAYFANLVHKELALEWGGVNHKTVEATEDEEEFISAVLSS